MPIRLRHLEFQSRTLYMEIIFKTMFCSLYFEKIIFITKNKKSTGMKDMGGFNIYDFCESPQYTFNDFTK